MSSTQQAECQLNTTECILQAAVSILTELQENNGQYNWDPLSFGVTLVIGIIALFFAALTIGQGLLAAGPGRHKSSRYALGPWAGLSSRQFDFRELRYRNIAYTPILSRVRDNWDAWPDMDAKLEKTMPLMLSPELDGVRGPKNKSKDMNEYFPATWLALLTLTLTDDPKLWDQKAIGTDYMPSDLPVAPAYATMTDLVVFSCLAAFPTSPRLLVETESGFPSVQCDQFQLVFRTHPLLGAFGVFQTYNPRRKPALAHRAEMLRRLRLSFAYASGHIPPRHRQWKPLLQSNRFHLSASYDQDCIMFAKDLNNCQGCGDAGEKCCSVPGLLQPCWCSVAKNEDVYEFFEILKMSPAVVMSAKYHYFPPIVFPTKAFRIRDKVMPLLCLSRLWSLGQYDWKRLLFPNAELPSRIPRWTILGQDMVTWEMHFSDTHDPSSQYPWANLGGDETPYQAFRAYCAGPEQWAANCGDSSGFIRSSILKEVAVIDQWLDTHVPPDVFQCRATSLSVSSGWCSRILALCKVEPVSTRTLNFATKNTSGQINELLRKLGYLTGALNREFSAVERSYIDGERHEEEQRLMMGDGGLWSPVSIGIESVKEQLSKIYQLWELQGLSEADFRFGFPRSAQHPLDDLLIYRTFLFAMLLELATDVSELVKNEDCNRIIPIF